VGGSRHYTGGGLGEIGAWDCPTCGQENTGPLTQGCVHCGAGKPATAPPPPPTPPPPVPLHDDDHVYNGDLADRWAAAHASVSIAEAYRAGYLDGIHAARSSATPVRPAAPASSLLADPRSYRSMIVALELFRDQVLTGMPEEIERGEWLTAVEASVLIGELQQLLARGVPA
jgi:hypothetical protein